MKFFSALGRAFWVFLAQIFALAIAEGFGGLHILPFGSRKPLLFLMLSVSLAAAYFRWRSLSAREATSQPQSFEHPHKSSKAAEEPVATEVLARLERLAANARAAEVGIAVPTQQPVPVPPPTPPAPPVTRDPLIDAAGRQAILFRQYFPPPHDPSILSFWGGAPVAPSGFEWPRSTTGKPLHFLMQLDSAGVPASARLGALPDTGVLYFFLDLEWGEDGGHAVIHQAPKDGEPGVVEPPDDLGPLFGKHAAYSWAWAQTAEQCPRLFPKWPFEAVAIEVPPFVPEDEEDEDFPILWPERSVQDAVVAAGVVAESNFFTVKDFMDGGTVRRPFSEFPNDWRAIQICSAQLVERIDKARRYPEARLFEELDPEAKDARLAAIGADVQAWFDRALAQPPFDPVSPADRDSFWELLGAHPQLARYMVKEAVVASIESSLAGSAETAARVPPPIADRIRSRHALATRTETGFHVNIPDRMLAPPIDVQGNQWERAQTHLLLLEISSNDGLGHHFGEGVYQFWIAPEDLRAGRFDRVELTSDAY